MEKILGVTTASKAWPPLLPAQTIQSKRILKTHPQLPLIALYKPNSGVKKRERERETERWSDKYVCRESDKNSATSTFFNFVFAAQYKI